MLKYLILLINSLALFFLGLFTADGVIISAKLPDAVKPGGEFVAELSIKKGTVNGFAKLQITLPDGFTAKELESKGGTFTFENHVVKYIWTALPAEQEIIVKFNVAVDASQNGPKQITGKFSYITNNVKQQLDMDPITIKVENDAAGTVTTTTTTMPDSAAVASKDSATTAKPATPGGVLATRTITPETTAGHYKVSITINKQDIKGFAKLVEALPYTAKATALKTSGASFSVVDHNAKFVWVSLPKDEVLQLEYELTFSQAVTSDQKITGELSYLEDDQSKKLKISGQETVNPNASAPVTNNNPIVSTPPDTTNKQAVNPETTRMDNVAGNTPVTTNTNTVTPVDTSKTKQVTTNDTNSNVAVTNPVKDNNIAKQDAGFAGNNTVQQGNVNYGVQIGAYKTQVNMQYYVKKYAITEPIRTDMHEGFTKCIIGNFGEYKNARDRREDMRGKGISGAFVTAYNSGKRITVQEALMISNQKWFR